MTDPLDRAAILDGHRRLLGAFRELPWERAEDREVAVRAPVAGEPGGKGERIAGHPPSRQGGNEMTRPPEPPDTYKAFTERFPGLADGWSRLSDAGDEGPLDPATSRLIRLAVAAGAMREGAVRASVRKAHATGIPRDEVEQVVALSAGTLGLPAAVAVWSWMRDFEAWDDWGG
jgi:4-carboxymuconolactone decarboxylase